MYLAGSLRRAPCRAHHKKGFARWMQTHKIKMVVGGGFGPPKAWPVDLQSTAFDRSATPPGNSTWSG